jgi:hypothetical protein
MRTGVGEDDVFGADWVDHLQNAAYAYNIRLNKRIGMPPATAFLGRAIDLAPPILPASLNAPDRDTGESDDAGEVSAAIDRIKVKIQEDKERHEQIVFDDIERRAEKIKKFRAKHGEQRVLKEGDFVSVLATNRHKVQHPATWPPRKIAVASDGTYTLYKADQHHIDRKRKYKIEQLKLWKGDAPEPIFYVQDVIAAKVTKEASGPVVRVLIAWRDYPHAADRSWEPAEVIRSSIPARLMAKFERFTAAKLAKARG